VLCLAAIIAAGVGTPDCAAADLQTIVAQLQRRESLIRSVQAEADVVERPTSEEGQRRIQEALRRQGKTDDWPRYILDEQDAAEGTFHLRWWQEGLKARSEARSASGVTEPSITAFDGVLVRELSTARNERLGSINTAEGAHWYASTRRDSLDYLLGYHGMLYSELIAQGRDVTSETVRSKDGEVLNRIIMMHPKDDKFWLRIAVDSTSRVREFQVVAEIGKTPRRLYERWEFDDFRAVADKRGEKIEYPARAVWHLCLGEFDDLGSVDWSAPEYSIRSIQFNADIPDETFTFAFPSGIKFWDGVNGIGWKTNEQTAAVQNFTPEETGSRLVWLTVGLGSALLAAPIALYIVSRRRGRAVRSAA